MKIVKGNEAQSANNYIKMVIYGASGAGKTVFGSTAPKTLFLDAEAGLLSIQNKNIDSVKIEKFSDIQEVFMFLLKGGHGYETVVIDSLTEIQKKSMDAILKKEGKGEDDKPRIQDWGTNIEQIAKMCRNFRDLPMNVIFISLENTEKDEENGITTKTLALQGKTLPQQVMGFVDLVGYIYAQERATGGIGSKKEIVRQIRFQPTQNINAKDRSGKLSIDEEPDFTKIYNKIFGKAEKTQKEKVNENTTIKPN